MARKIIGQEKVIGDLDRIFKIFKASEGAIRPHSILTGPSGTGKSLLTKHLAHRNEVGFLDINAAQLTKEGTSGNSLSKALSPMITRANQMIVCFVDEFDKLFISGNNNSDLAHESTNGVQNEFLRVLESDQASVYGDYGKYVNVPIDQVLFIFAGAFNNEENISVDRLREFGVKTEFIGRVGLVFNTQPLTLEHLNEILETSPLLDTYLQLFTDTNREEVVNELKKQLKKLYKKNSLGARIINSMINLYFIKGGEVGEGEYEKAAFQETMSLKRESSLSEI